MLILTICKWYHTTTIVVLLTLYLVSSFTKIIIITFAEKKIVPYLNKYWNTVKIYLKRLTLRSHLDLFFIILNWVSFDFITVKKALTQISKQILIPKLMTNNVYNYQIKSHSFQENTTFTPTKTNNFGNSYLNPYHFKR